MLKNKLFFGRQFYTLHEFFSFYPRPLLSITFPQGFQKSKKFTYWTVERSEKHQYQKKSYSDWVSVWQNSLKNQPFLHGNFTPFIIKSFQIWHHFFSLLFPKDSESLKTLDIKLQEVGTKRHLNGASKVNRRTGTQTDGQTDGHFDL